MNQSQRMKFVRENDGIKYNKIMTKQYDWNKNRVQDQENLALSQI